MRWEIALVFAKNQRDVTYEEWCNLYVDMREPTKAQVEHAMKTAHPILVRNNVIEESVVLSYER
jgi:hypothetical protein